MEELIIPANLGFLSAWAGPEILIELRWNTLRGMYYQVQSTTSLDQPFTNEPGGATLAYDAYMARTNPVSGTAKFFRVLAALTP